MKRFRLPVLVAGALGVLLVLAVAVLFSSTFQTWAVRRAIAAEPGLKVSVGSVSAGLKRAELTNLRFERGGAVLAVPRVEIDVPMFPAAWDRNISITRLVAKGWTLNLTNAAATPAVIPAMPPASSTGTEKASARGTVGATHPAPGGAGIAEAASRGFAGIFSQLQIPADVSIAGVQIEGDVILPESRGRVKLTVTGGGLSAGREGKFDVVAEAGLSDPKIKTVDVRGAVTAAMDTPRTFTRMSAKLEVAASGTQFPRGLKLHADLSAARSDAGEAYRMALLAEGQEVIGVKAELPHGAPKFEGTWKVDVRDSDLAPFAFGKPLPTFSAVGEGTFDGDAQFEAIHLAGRLNATVAGLQVILPELAAIGELKIAADFDLAERDGAFAVQKLEAAINAAQPVATVRALQAFEFNPRTGALRTADVSLELVGLSLHALPVSWAAAFLKGLQVAGGHMRGELSAAARNGGLTVRATSPLMIDGVSVARAGKPMLDRVDVALNASADYTPHGWQAEVVDLTMKAGDANLLSLEAKAGQLVGQGQPLKATGKLNANLPALLTQPVAAGNLSLSRGEAAMEFVVSFNAKDELQANLSFKHLATGEAEKLVLLPSISTQLRADLSADGRIAFNAPLLIERADRKSDLTIIGSIGPEKDAMRAIDAEISSTQLVMEDAQILGAMVPDKSVRSDQKDPAGKASRDAAPPWSGLHGSLSLQLKNVIYSDALQVSNVTGRLRLDAGTLKLETLQAGLGETGRANVNGTLTFNSAAPQPYAMVADVALREFDPGPLFRSLTENRAATVEGKFDVISKLAGRASTFSDLASGAEGHFQLTSKGGVFRGLPVNVGNIVENTGKLAAWIASTGTALSAMIGKKEYTDVANKAEAVAELARGLYPIPYDQLSVVVSRDAGLNTTLRNFSLISPEVRLTGNGTALHTPGSSLLDDSLAMEFTLRARGRQGELLKYLGALEPQTDDLGYATCSVPLKVGGTLGKPDTSELNSKLTALAIEKSGFGDKAAELLNKIRGGK
jgi:hypothetical protein